MSKIFISYRRSDSQDITDRIYGELRAAFGEKHIFRDIDSIRGAVDFRTALTNALQHCVMALIIIGPTWAKVTDERGQPRLFDPKDFVRQEVELALSRRGMVQVFPLLVRGAAMPSAEQLPSSLAQLAYQNARLVRPDPDFRHDMERVIKDIIPFVPLADPPGKPLLVQGEKALLRGDYAAAERYLHQAETLLHEDELPREAAKVKYLLALCQFNGRRPYVQTLPTMRSVDTLMRAALALHPAASYFLIFAIFKHDFGKNGLPGWSSEAAELARRGNTMPQGAEDQENFQLLAACLPTLAQEYLLDR